MIGPDTRAFYFEQHTLEKGHVEVENCNVWQIQKQNDAKKDFLKDCTEDLKAAFTWSGGNYLLSLSLPLLPIIDIIFFHVLPVWRLVEKPVLAP